MQRRRARAGGHVEDRRVVQALLVVVLGRRIAAALLRQHVHDDRPVEVGGVAQRVFEAGDVVAVDRADVANAERLEEHGGLGDFAHRGGHALPRLGHVRPDHGKFAGHLLAEAAEVQVLRVEAQPAHALGQRRHRRRVRAAVVVEHDHAARPAVAEVVQRLVGHAAGHRTVADDRHDVAIGGALARPTRRGRGRSDRIVDAWLFSTQSCSDSTGSGSRDSPSSWRSASKRSARPVTILCA